VSDVGSILDGWGEAGILWVRFELPDMHGISRSKTVPIEHAPNFAANGLNMYGGTAVLDTRSDVVSGTLYNEERMYGDQLLHPDPETAAVVPWADRTARFICDSTWRDGEPLEATPRHVFRRALDRCRRMGFEPMIGTEYEFYLLDGDTHEPLFEGYHIFNTLRNDYVPTVRRILELMPQVGVSLITANCEYAGSQYEIPCAPGAGLHGPDNAFTFRNGVKEIAKQDGLLATFMSKPFADSAGSGNHTHVSLLRTEDGANAFGDDADPIGISETCRQFTGGLLRHANSIDALIAPTANCHRRRRRHTFSPTNISWGAEDRAALVRVKGGAIESRHLEFRAASSLANPYLVCAALLQAGLQGIEDRIDPGPTSKPGIPAEDDDDFEKLPTSIHQALDEFENEPTSREFFGDDFVAAYTTMRRHELSRFNDWVTDWERQEYLELF
jgi:glutamine synthetase